MEPIKETEAELEANESGAKKVDVVHEETTETVLTPEEAPIPEATVDETGGVVPEAAA